MLPALDEDYHVHSAFSDDAVSTLAENVRAAARDRGLRVLCLVDHVRRDSPWVADYTAAVAALRPVPGLEVVAGVEAKILDSQGHLDLPEQLPGRGPGADRRPPVPRRGRPGAPARHPGPADRGPAHRGGGDRRPDHGDRPGPGSGGEPAARPPVQPAAQDGAGRAGWCPARPWPTLAQAARRAGAWSRSTRSGPARRRARSGPSPPPGCPLVPSTDSHDCADVGRYATVRRLLAAAAASQVPG